MIDQDLLDKNERLLNEIALGDLTLDEAASDLMELLCETNGNYIKLIEKNAELHKKLAKLTCAVLEKERVFVVNGGEK